MAVEFERRNDLKSYIFLNINETEILCREDEFRFLLLMISFPEINNLSDLQIIVPG